MIADKAGARVSWHVFHSAPTPTTFFTRSVLQDDGYIDFSRTADGKVLVTTHSKHVIDSPPLKAARLIAERPVNQLVGQLGLRGYFTDVVQNYRAIAEGAVEPARFDRE